MQEGAGERTTTGGRPEELVFAVATPAERGEVERVMRAAFAPYVRKLGRELTPASYDWLVDALAAGRVHVAWDGADLVGAVATTPRDGCGEFVIDQVAVDPARQGRGIGSWLLGRVEAMARDAGFRRLSLDTAEMMGDLLRLYARHGFREVRRGRPAHGKDAHTRVFLAKPLAVADAGTPAMNA